MGIINFKTIGFVGVNKDVLDWRIGLSFVKDDEHKDRMTEEFLEGCDDRFPIGVFEGVGSVERMIEAYFANFDDDQIGIIAQARAQLEVDKVLEETGINAS